MRSVNRILDVIGCEGTLQFRLPIAKLPLRYLVGSQTLIFLAQMRNVISGRNITTRSNTDTRLTPKGFCEPGLNRKIAIHEMGGVCAFNDSTGRLGQAEELKQEEGTQDAITELKSLMRGRNTGRNSPGNLRISGSLEEGIAETLIYGKNKNRQSIRKSGI